MSEIDYEELIRSPLDGIEESTGTGWGWSAIGLATGGLVGLAMALIFGGSTEPVVAPTAPPSTVSPVVADVVSPAYPDDYAEIAPGLGARIGEISADDESITVAVDTVVERDGDVLAPIWPVGGTWWLESESGAAAESSRVVLARFSPGVFSVEFPVEPFGADREFTTVRMAERWDQRELAGSTSLPFTGEPFAAAESVSVAVDQDVTLILPTINLGRFLGRVEWKLQGPELGGSVHITAILLDAAGAEIGRYQAFPDLMPPRTEGTSEIFWDQHFSIDQTGADEVVFEFRLRIADSTPVAISFDLTGGAVGQ
ncbi:MAG: hypothetical protein GY788_13670 [bacterium]|nr:hypothetical protein [bacterium]